MNEMKVYEFHLHVLQKDVFFVCSPPFTLGSSYLPPKVARAGRGGYTSTEKNVQRTMENSLLWMQQNLIHVLHKRKHPFVPSQIPGVLTCALIL